MAIIACCLIYTGGKYPEAILWGKFPEKKDLTISPNFNVMQSNERKHPNFAQE
jgi:hypothetical protein